MTETFRAASAGVAAKSHLIDEIVVGNYRSRRATNG